jgi:phage terminase large subunit-like protein
MPVKLTEKQLEAQDALGEAANVMLWGGSRSGKTFIIIKSIIYRALAAPGSRHVILRFRFSHVKQSVVLDTFPKVMSLCFPGVSHVMNKTDFFVTFGNKSEIWFGGLDDKERTEKILGSEYATIYLNESSQISWASVGIVRTRLAQSVDIKVENCAKPKLTPRMYYDANPPSKAHWSYLVFIRKVDPETKEPLDHPEQYANMQMNPGDNLENLAEGYLETLRTLSSRQQRRFLEGKFADATPGQLFTEEDIDKWRIVHADNLPDFVRVVVGVDPSGADDEDNADNDEIGIVVGALGTDGNGYLLEDVTVKAGPGVWGRVAASAWERHAADCVVAEINFGGAMVKQTIHVANPRIPYRKVTASRGKTQRAEPFSALYESGKIRHVGRYDKLEDELTAFSTVGYLGGQSPNRADAWIWVLAELFSGIVKPKVIPKSKRPQARDYQPGGHGWMR